MLFGELNLHIAVDRCRVNQLLCTLTIGKCAMRRQMLKCCKWLCGSNNCVELSVSDEYSTECKPRVEQSMISVTWLQLHWGMMHTFPPTQTKKVTTVVYTNSKDILFVCFVSSVKSLKTFNITFPKKLLTAREQNQATRVKGITLTFTRFVGFGARCVSPAK